MVKEWNKQSVVLIVGLNKALIEGTNLALNLNKVQERTIPLSSSVISFTVTMINIMRSTTVVKKTSDTT